MEYFGCDPLVLNDQSYLEKAILEAATAAGATPLRTVFHQFSPQGVTGVVIIAESHLSIHTWPERGYASVDFYTCGDATPEQATQVLLQQLRASHCEVLDVRRGVNPAGAPGKSSLKITPPRLTSNDLVSDGVPAVQRVRGAR